MRRALCGLVIDDRATATIPGGGSGILIGTVEDDTRRGGETVMGCFRSNDTLRVQDGVGTGHVPILQRIHGQRRPYQSNIGI